jgi:hypothetical protein
MSTPHIVQSKSTTKCIIGPFDRLIYGGEKITQKFIFSRSDTEENDYQRIERIDKDQDGNYVEFTYLFPDPSPTGVEFNLLLVDEDSTLLLAASETHNKLHIFYYQ